MNIVLIGYRATGKTTVAQALARRLGWDWVDADVEVELRAGANIATIFADCGEAAFRDMESAVLRELLTRPHTVVATGGGAVLRPENRQQLHSAGSVVWLQATQQTILERLASDAVNTERRPSLTNMNLGDEVERLLAVREPLYRECATLVVNSEGRSPEQIVDEICGQLSWLPGASEQA